MLRALFLQELRRSWLAHAGLFATGFGIAALLKRLATRESPLSPAGELSLGLLLLASLLLSGLISGERCFPAAFKEGRYAFLLTLPRPRGGIWLAYLGGRLSGVLAALPILLLAGPALQLQWQLLWSWPFLLAALSVYLVYFLGSGTLALAIRREILVYLVGIPLLTGLLVLLAYNLSYGFAPPYLRTLPDLLESSRYLETFSCGSLLLALMWTAVSLRAFCRGETHLGRRTARTLAEAGLASATFVGLALIAFSSSMLAAFGGKWRPAAPDGIWFPYQADLRPISANGRFLFIRQQLREQPLFTRLAVVDLESGKTTRWMERPGIYQISWSASEAVLNVLVVNDTPFDCLGIPCTGSTSWYRLSPDLHVLSTRKFPGTGFLHQLGSCLLLVTRQESAGRMYRLSDRDGSFSEILTWDLEYDPDAWSVDGGAVVVSTKAASLRAWWLDPQGQVQHEASVNRRHQETYYFVGHRILSSQEVRAEAIQRAFPPSKNPENWEPLLPKAGGPLDFGSSQFYYELGQEMTDIWRYDKQHGTWTRILSALRTGELRHMLNLLLTETMEHSGSGLPLARFDVDLRTGTLVAAVASEGRPQLFLYDDRLGRSIPNTVACGPGEEGRTSLEQVQGLSGLLVRFACWDETDLLGYWLLEFVPVSGRVRDLPWHSTIARSEHFSHWIYLDPDGISVWVSTTGEVWQAGPGRKRLRLNPPAG